MRGTFSIPSAWLTEPIDVAVVGCGGTGSELIDGLARLHVVLKALGHPGGLSLALYDDDLVSSANVGRQRFLPTDVGERKAVVLAQRYNFAYGMSIKAFVRQVHEVEDIEVFGARANQNEARLVITCIDKAKARLTLADSFTADHNTTSDIWLDCGNGKTDGQCVMGHCIRTENQKALRLPTVADLFRRGLETTDDRAEPSCSVEESLQSQALGINRLVADFAVFSLLAPLLTNGSLEFHGGFVDMAKGRMTPLLIDTAAWSFMGYEGRIPARQAEPVRRLAPRRRARA